MSPLAMTHTDKPEMAALYRAVAADLRAQYERLENAGPMSDAVHYACQWLQGATRWLERAADQADRESESGGG